MSKEPGGTIFDQIGDEFESFITAVVGIGDLVVAVLAAEVGEFMDTGAMVVGFGELHDVGVILIVHRQDEIEDFKISHAELTS